MDDVIAAARAGRRLAVYPEGTLTRRPGLLAFKLGAFAAAAAAGVPVVPVTLHGTRTVPARRPVVSPPRRRAGHGGPPAVRRAGWLRRRDHAPRRRAGGDPGRLRGAGSRRRGDPAEGPSNHAALTRLLTQRGVNGGAKDASGDRRARDVELTWGRRRRGGTSGSRQACAGAAVPEFRADCAACRFRRGEHRRQEGAPTPDGYH